MSPLPQVTYSQLPLYKEGVIHIMTGRIPKPLWVTDMKDKSHSTDNFVYVLTVVTKQLQFLKEKPHNVKKKVIIDKANENGEK